MEIAIPVYQPSLTGNEKKYVNECLDSTWISSKGKFIGEFEQAFSEYIQVSYASTVCNGTVALHLALVALDIGPGDEVIVPTLTYIASVNAIKYTGATPVFVDSLPETWQMDPADVEKKVTAKTRAIMVVHLYGHACDMERLTAVCGKHSLFMIEDCAEAIGSLYKGKHVGTFGDIATFSFFGNKTITSGEGGMVVTNTLELHEKVVHLKGQGLAKNRQYWHDIIGYNYRMTNICAAIALAQLEQVNTFIDRKQEIATRYKDGFSNSPVTFHHQHSDVTHSYWMCSVLVNQAADRDKLIAFLADKGIETRPLFYPAHEMPMYKRGKQHFVNAAKLSAMGINLPSFPQLTNGQVDDVIAEIDKFFKIEINDPEKPVKSTKRGRASKREAELL